MVRGVQIFEPVGKKLLGRHALGGDLQVCFCKIWSGVLKCWVLKFRVLKCGVLKFRVLKCWVLKFGVHVFFLRFGVLKFWVLEMWGLEMWGLEMWVLEMWGHDKTI